MTALDITIFWVILGYAIIVQLITVLAAYYEEILNRDLDCKIDISSWTWGSGTMWFLFSYTSSLTPIENYFIASKDPIIGYINYCHYFYDYWSNNIF